MSTNQELKTFNNKSYKPGNFLKRTIWYVLNEIFIRNRFFIWSKPKVLILKLFGAKVGSGVIIKPGVNIKYPWNLKIGDFCWIGEGVWIDNLDDVDISNNVCLSQGSMLLCGNHDFKKSTFDLITKKITIKEGCWVGAKAIVCPGVTLHSSSILTVNSVASTDLKANGIYKGNPARLIRERKIC